MAGSGLILLGLAFIDSTKSGLAVFLLTLSVTLIGAALSSGFFTSHFDIAPRYAGTLMGLSNGLGAVSGIVAPYVTSVLTKSVICIVIIFAVLSIHLSVYAFGFMNKSKFVVQDKMKIVKSLV